MPDPVTITVAVPYESAIVAVAAAVKSVFDYQRLLLEKVPEQATLIAEQAKPWLALAKALNKLIGVSEP